jgi:hypothetical protein
MKVSDATTGQCGCGERAVGSRAIARTVSYALACDEQRRAEHAYQFERCFRQHRKSPPPLANVNDESQRHRCSNG